MKRKFIQRTPQPFIVTFRDGHEIYIIAQTGFSAKALALEKRNAEGCSYDKILALGGIIDVRKFSEVLIR